MPDTPDMPDTPSFRAWWAGRPPAAGAAVLATGIISVGLQLTGYETLSRIALVLASLAWLGLAAEFAARLVRDREQWMRQAGTPAGLTAVAATTVLGTRFSALGWQGLAEALLALSAALWPVLLLAVVRHRRRRMTGGVFLVCVATQGLSVLGSTIATAVGTDWLAHAALVLFWLGIVLYGVSFAHFDLWEVKRGAGDHWVAGGALAISALAGARLVAAHHASPYLWNDDDQGVLRATTGALLVLDLTCYCVLLVTEAVWPRLRYDVLRWSTVFPMGMTAVSTLSVAAALGVFWLKGPGQVLLWFAVAAWLAVAAGSVLAVRSAARG
ncbi:MULTISPECIES: tellurite resistance/C4-dicarboxylate transporter family protein [unclassified Streptomyces]|uniref:tellurite resistance/C4-dicarboxylate transporter family protein n=1 Tax=unclassified Streptomyces TaxID=2593676 RepID=UPI002257239C|nr:MULTISPECIES: tellurite resistance/C4-dicarboxylate transporter family protein [unclassified Streptomyces]MCX4988982.1 tellurite resistance/C4-dicarboxylate transporter family protein [Streptomyces sp. NBC_00568]MCX5005797.1 tellurite resistance/C4-dicarboxylate transporter family protein [Streptomyces sp. NBC_00638]